MSSTHFTIIELPVLVDDEESRAIQSSLVDRYRSFRLDSLQSDPEAFASSYDGDKAQPLEFWVKRLSNPKARHFAAVHGGVVDGRGFDTEWYGMIVMVGPDTESPAANQTPWKANDLTQPTDGSPATGVHFHLVGTFTSPNHRRKGIGRALLQKCLDVATEEKRRLESSVRITVHVDVGNAQAKGMHEAFGFAVIGEEAYQPAPTAQGPRPEKRAYLLEMLIP